MVTIRQKQSTYAITILTFQRHRHFQRTANAGLFIATLFRHREQSRFQLHAFVVMPDHTHVLITPATDQSTAKCVQCIKGGYSFAARQQSPGEIWHSGYYPLVWTNRRYRMVYCNFGHNDIDYEGHTNATLSHTFDSAPQEPCRSKTDRSTCHQEPQRFANHQAHDAPRSRSHGDTNPEFASAPRYLIRRESVQPDGGHKRCNPSGPIMDPASDCFGSSDAIVGTLR